MDSSPLGAAGPGHRATIAQAAERIAAADRVLVTCHRGPDGDSVGSMIALSSLLGAQGKEVTLYNPDAVPRRLKWMPLTKRFVRRLGKNAAFPLTIVVDCADARLLGKTFPGPAVTGELIALDHHRSSQPFGDLYVCDPAASSVGLMVARLAKHLGWSIPADAALGIYVSLVSDTGSFSYANTTPEAFHLAAELVESGVDPGSIHAKLNERATMERYALLSKALESLDLRLDGKVAFMTITHEMVKQAGAAWEDTVDLVNYSRAMDGVECGILFTPAKFGGIRVSMRSKSEIDCGQLCESLGGGGHPGAAGCVLDTDMAAAKRRIESDLARALGMEAPDEPDGETGGEPDGGPGDGPGDEIDGGPAVPAASLGNNPAD